MQVMYTKYILYMHSVSFYFMFLASVHLISLCIWGNCLLICVYLMEIFSVWKLGLPVLIGSTTIGLTFRIKVYVFFRRVGGGECFY